MSAAAAVASVADVTPFHQNGMRTLALAVLGLGRPATYEDLCTLARDTAEALLRAELSPTFTKALYAACGDVWVEREAKVA